MNRKLDGLLLWKYPYKERDLLGQVLLRNGKRLQLLFPGGQGGGKKKKSSGLEIGHLIHLELFLKQNQALDLIRVKEWGLSWYHEHIRENYLALGMMCFYLEMIARISLQGHPEDPFFLEQQEDQGLFRVLSNALFFLDRVTKEKKLQINREGATFLGKLLLETGLTPQLDQCHYCEKEADIRPGENPWELIFAEGGICCPDCQVSHLGTHQGYPTLAVPFLRQVRKVRYADAESLLNPDGATLSKLYHFFCYQCHLDINQLKAFNSLHQLKRHETQSL